MEERVILVDEHDKEIGTEEKMKAHREAKLHRCFSIFIFNSKGKFMLVKRASSKHHSGGLWTNTCCSHPRPGEDTLDAAHRRLKEEMGFDTKLEEIFSFTYKAALDQGMHEHEYDHVFLGTYDKDPLPDLKEAEDWKFADAREIQDDMKKNPQKYTAWFLLSFDRVAKAAKPQKAKADTGEFASLADLQKLDIRIGKIIHAERIANTDKLLRLEIDFGVETRQVVTGMAEFFEPSHFLGKEIPVIVNLQPRMIKGIESQGMILAAEAAGRPVLMHPEKDIPPGSMIR